MDTILGRVGSLLLNYLYFTQIYAISENKSFDTGVQYQKTSVLFPPGIIQYKYVSMSSKSEVKRLLSFVGVKNDTMAYQQHKHPSDYHFYNF